MKCAICGDEIVKAQTSSINDVEVHPGCADIRFCPYGKRRELIQELVRGDYTNSKA